MNKSQARGLVNCLERLSLGNGRRRRRSRRARAQPRVVVAAPAVAPRRQRRRARRQATNSTPGTQGAAQTVNMGRSLAQGEVVVSRSELLTTPGTDVAGVVLHPANFPWLKKLALVFERYRFQNLRLEYRPLVGANTDGYAAFGVDWGTSSMSVSLVGSQWHISREHLKSADKTNVLALTPSVDTPVWQRVPSLVVPQKMLQARLWYDTLTPASPISDYAPGYVQSIATAASKGEIWVHYTAHFAGTRA